MFNMRTACNTAHVKSILWLFLNVLQHILGNSLQFNFSARQVVNKDYLVHNNNRLLLFCPTPSWGKTEQIAHVRSSSCGIAQKTVFVCHTAEAGWGAGAKTLCTAALPLVYSTAEYCTPV